MGFTLLAKPTGAVCNLACEYCFYLGKEQLYPHSLKRMSGEVLEAYIQQILALQPASETCIAWQGGEPTLMGLDFFRHSIELVDHYRKPGRPVSYTLQTNGTRLDEEWCAFFKQHHFLIGLSMDGPQEMHDAFRVDKGGKGSFKQVKASWELLQKYEVNTNILCTIHSVNASYPLEVYRFFRDELQADFIQFIPIVERLPSGPLHHTEESAQEPHGRRRHRMTKKGKLVSPRSVKPEQFGTFLIDIFEEWVHHDVGNVFIQTFEAALASWCHLPASLCIFQEVCGSSLVLEHNGDLYVCDHFVEPEYRLGNIMESPLVNLTSALQQQQFGLDKRERLPTPCRECEVLFACHGECPRNRFVRSIDGKEAGLNYLCSGYKRFFQHVDLPMRVMSEILLNRRTAAEIMDML